MTPKLLQIWWFIVLFFVGGGYEEFVNRSLGPNDFLLIILTGFSRMWQTNKNFALCSAPPRHRISAPFPPSFHLLRWFECVCVSVVGGELHACATLHQFLSFYTNCPALHYHPIWPTSTSIAFFVTGFLT